jgi:lipopolysaccharide transport system ATP-binding protein
MNGSIVVSGLGKAYKQYPNRLARLLEWLDPSQKPRHHLHWVLQNINLAIESGESVGIVGVNGAGKSTLLKMITGTTQPTVGSIHITGRVAALLELGTGFHPDFTGRQNAYMAGQLRGYTNEEMTSLMPQIETFAEIGEYIDQPMRVYSSGMQMRLAFSVATAARPDVLIVDEALSVGDAYFQAKCYQRISQHKKDGTTLLLVSHSPGDIVKHCDRAILLKNGKIVSDGSSREVSNRYLDELFGKAESNLCEPNSDDVKSNDSSEIYDSLFDNYDDVFNSRPGYRKEEHRWGHGGAEILDYLVVTGDQFFPPIIEGNAKTDFYFKVRFNSNFDSVVPGFLIKTIEGIFLYGTNSFISNKTVEKISARANEVKIFRFSLPMAVNQGYYLISFGISAGDPIGELIPLDRRYDSVLLYVQRPIQFWGIADLNSAFDSIDQEAETVTL